MHARHVQDRVDSRPLRQVERPGHLGLAELTHETTPTRTAPDWAHPIG